MSNFVCLISLHACLCLIKWVTRSLWRHLHLRCHSEFKFVFTSRVALAENDKVTCRREMRCHNTNTSSVQHDWQSNIEDLSGIWTVSHELETLCSHTGSHVAALFSNTRTNVVILNLAVSTWSGCQSKGSPVSNVAVERASEFVAAACNTWTWKNITSCVAKTLLQQLRKAEVNWWMCKLRFLRNAAMCHAAVEPVDAHSGGLVKGE